MKKMNKIVVGTLVVSALWAGSALALRGPQGVSSTIHNLSTSSPEFQYTSDNETEVCIFCHTPHSGSLDGPLWNRALPTATKYTHYNSASLSALGAGRAVEKESLLCLSCHDGSISVNTLMNYRNSFPFEFPEHFGSQNYPIPFLGFPDGMNPGGKIGASRGNDIDTDLSDDHPISFKYKSVADIKFNEFKDVPTAEGAGVRFFPGNADDADKRVECSSCHDPHVMYDTFTNPMANETYRPFLITTNAGSALCLACHTK